MKRNLIYEFKFLPLKIRISKKKHFILNINNYRNAHYQVLNKAKREYKGWFKEAYGYNVQKGAKFAFCGECILRYRFFFPTARRVDLGNCGAVVDKFVSDCLVDLNYIQDDSREFIKEVTFADGGIDRENPRAELEVYEV